MSNDPTLQKFKDGWHGGLPETPCGFGSRIEETGAQRAWIPKMVRRYKIKTIADIGAGDLNWIREVKLPKTVSYQAFDLVVRDPSVQPLDIRTQVPPKVDLLLCLWVLNHLSRDEQGAAMENLRASGSRYLMLTARPAWYDHQHPATLVEAVQECPLTYSEPVGDKGDVIKLVRLC